LCSERWTTNVDPAIKKTPFTPEEDNIILEQWNVHGAKWSIICELLPGRAQVTCREIIRCTRVAVVGVLGLMLTLSAFHNTTTDKGSG
jgi:hypothetical protein